MKILHINIFLHAGGAEQITYSLFKSNPENSIAISEQVVNDNNVIFLSRGFNASFFSFLTKIKWRIKPDFTFKNIFFLNEKFNNTYQKLSRLEVYQNADIIHLHNIHGGYFDLDALLKIGKEKKVVWTLHDMWAMTGGEAYTFENENYKIGIGKTPYLNVPPLNNPIVDRRQYYIEKKKKIYDEIYKNITFITVSKWLENCFKSAYVYSNKLNIQTIYNGYDVDVFFPVERTETTNCKILIFNSSSPFKGSSDFKQIIESIKIPFELFIVGGNISIENEHAISISVQPYISDRNQLAKLYNDVDVLVFPSKAEAFGLIPLEAMACGVCVFASNIDGIPEIIEHAKTGFLFNTISELSTQLNNTIQDKKLLREIGNNAAIAAKTKFSLRKMIDSYENLYKNIATHK